MKQDDSMNLSLRNMLILTSFLGILLIAASFIFGVRVFAVAAVSYAVSFVIEMTFTKLRGKELDNSWMVTPMIFALLVPPNAPLWMVGIGAGFAVFFGKMIFGGLGKTVFNPALVGIIFVTVSFIPFMTTQWLDPVSGEITSNPPIVALTAGHVDLQETWSIGQLLLGNVPGMIGETFLVGIVALGIALLILKIADWRITASLLVSYGIIQFIIFFITEMIDSSFTASVMFAFENALYGYLVGTLLFAAFFVATDPVTAPDSARGRIIYGIGIAFLTVIIRTFSAFPEGVLFAIILMNAVTPHIDDWYESKASKGAETEAEA